MQRLVDKYGLYCQHLQHAISEMKSAKDRTTLKGKLEKLMDAKVLLRSCLFLNVLSAAKQFSLVTQRSEIDIILTRSFLGNLMQMQKTYSLCQH